MSVDLEYFRPRYRNAFSRRACDTAPAVQGEEGPMTASRRIQVDRGRCSGHARCLELAPDLFDLDDEYVAVSLRQPATAAELDAARRAALACPEAAIQIEEAG